VEGLHPALLDDPFRLWVAAGAVLLAVEVATGTGWLLWAAACAGLMALVVLTPLGLELGGQMALFAVLTIVSTLAARKLMPHRPPTGHDINDMHARLTGKAGVAATAFSHGLGRVRVDGSEWDAEAETNPGAAAIAPGDPVIVEAVLGGARLAVRAAPAGT
jgi:membrane protein implicated in regulation of membrane protease activity